MNKADNTGIDLERIPDIPEGEPYSREWQAFKREVARLMAEGQQGGFAVFQGESLVGVWDSLFLADQAGRRQCGGKPFLIQEIQPVLKPMRWGYHRPCPS